MKRIALLLVAVVAVVAASGKASAATVAGNFLLDQDQGLQFSQNKQNENAIVRDPASGVLIAGANDEIQEPLCPGTSAPLASPCPFAAGVSVNGVYRSTDNGVTWAGTILPGTPAHVGGGDPSLDYGPARCSSGTFSWACGTTVYYASLGDPFPEFGGEQVLVYASHTDGATWSAPVEATSTNKTSDFDDHEWVAVDRSSAHFGRVYLFWALFCNSCAGNGNVKLFVAHSDDEGQTWSPAVQVSAGNNNIAQGFRETGQLAVSAQDGTVEAFWTENADSKKQPSLQVVAVSKDGGNTFSAPITIAQVADYPLTGTPFDIVDLFNRIPGMSARVDCYPHPAPDPDSNKVYVVWCDFANGNGTVQGAVSSDGTNWTRLPGVSVSGRNAFFPAAAVSPTGRVSLAFDALTRPPADNPWQTGVQVYDAYYAQLLPTGSWSRPLRISTASSNPDASSYNNLQEQFIGDYIDIAAGPTAAYAVWTDTRAASRCQAVDDYRSAVYAGSKTAVAPNPDNACQTNFGNSDSAIGIVDY
jgi:hypothetical protein